MPTGSSPLVVKRRARRKAAMLHVKRLVRNYEKISQRVATLKRKYGRSTISSCLDELREMAELKRKL